MAFELTRPHITNAPRAHRIGSEPRRCAGKERAARKQRETGGVFLRPRSSRTLPLVIGVLLSSTALAAPAFASCTTSTDGFTKNCTGDITKQELFNQLNLTENATSTYNFIISGLTSSSATSTVTPPGQESNVFSMFGTVEDNATDGNRNGINGPDQSFLLNTDGAASNFGVISENFVAIQLSSAGGNGVDGPNATGAGDRTGRPGGIGGTGGDITVTIRDADLQAKRLALLVQSFGGLAGNGGLGDSASGGDGVGGTGGNGGESGAIAINLNAVSASNSTNEPAIQISNLGGQAGTGGEGKANVSGRTGTGGTGGTGGLANEVEMTITNGLSVVSTGTGVLMTSTGGLGAEGGEGNLTQDKGTVKGGTGGDGGQGGAITFQSSADSEQIEIDATNGPAVRLVSTGGQGGNGGRDQLPGAGDPFLSDGGTGGAGGAVTFSVASNDVTLKTTGQNNTGLVAESIGGAGGDAGTITGTSGAGNSGEGGDAGTVDVLLGTGNTSITSTNGNGLVAQSLGGAVVNTLSQDDIGSDQAGDGKTVTVRTSGTVSISAINGVRLYSEGGSAAVSGTTINGGTGGDGGDLYLDYDPDSSATGAWTVEVTGGSDPSYGFRLESVGGQSDTGGDGGDIYAGASGASYKVTSSGDGVNGALLVSKGGTGRNSAGDGALSTGSTAGDAGSVYVDGSWDIQLTGSGGAGMLVESLGGTNADQRGPGGSGKTVTFADTFVGQISTKSTGVSVLSSGTEGTEGGDAGDVTVRGAWAISSVGTGLSVTSSGGDSPTAGNGGVGGLVTVEIDSISSSGSGSSSPMIQTTAADAHGLDVLQESGENAPDSVLSTALVNVTIGGDIDVSGAGAQGVQVASSGNTRGAIQVTVLNDATINGGAASTSGTDGAAVNFIDGTANNILINEGTLTSRSGVAVQQSGTSSVFIQNNGTIIGTVPKNSEGGTITLANASSGTVSSRGLGVVRFENAGTFYAAGQGRAGTTTISGDFTQTSTGVTGIDIASNPGVDLVEVDGAAQIGGAIALQQITPAIPILGPQTATVLTAEEGIVLGSDFSYTRSVVAQYGLGLTEDGVLQLTFDNDFANPTALSRLSANALQVADYLQRSYETGLLDPNVFTRLVAAEDALSYEALVNTLTAEVALNNQITNLRSSLRFGDSLLSCADASGEGITRFYDDGQCYFAYVEARGFDYDRTNGSLGFDGSSVTIGLGGQIAYGEDWMFGGALAYETVDISDTDSQANSDGDLFMVGLSAKRQFGDFEFGASAAVGFGSYDLSRRPLTFGEVTGSQDQWSLSGQLRASYITGSDRFFLKPRIDLNIDHFFGSDFTESGFGGVAPLDVSTSAETYVSLQPVIEMGGEMTLANGTVLRPHASLGLTQFLTDPDPSLTARFVGAPQLPGFTHTGDFDRTYIDIAAGVDVFATPGTTTRAGAFASFSDNSQSYGGDLRVEVAF